MEKSNQFSIALLWLNLPEKIFFTVQWAGGREFWDEGWRGAKKHGKRRARGRNCMWPFLGLPSVITYITAGVSWFVQLWFQHVENALLGRYCLSHGLLYNLHITTLETSTYLINRKFPDPSFSFNFSIHTSRHYFDT